MIVSNTFEALTVVNAFFETTQELLQQGDKITFPGFGTFSVKDRAARMGKKLANRRRDENSGVVQTKITLLYVCKQNNSTKMVL